MIKIICTALVIIFEIPFVYKMYQAKYDIIRQTAIAVIMLLIPVTIFVLYKLLILIF